MARSLLFLMQDYSGTVGDHIVRSMQGGLGACGLPTNMYLRSFMYIDVPDVLGRQDTPPQTKDVHALLPQTNSHLSRKHWSLRQSFAQRTVLSSAILPPSSYLDIIQ